MISMQEVVSANRALLARARELNTRAGANFFSVPGRDELTTLFATVLGGARCVAEIKNLLALLLPLLDESLVQTVLAENPDTVTILDREAKVEYAIGRSPLVRLDFRGDESRKWINLPDDGIKLPSGREVSMYAVVEGHGYYIEAESSTFKAKVREYLNDGQWSRWQKHELPAPNDGVLPIVETEYGRCVVTNDALIAYGTTRYDSWSGSWKAYWSRDKKETEHEYANARNNFVILREKELSERLRKEISSWHTAHAENTDVPAQLRARLRNTRYEMDGGATTPTEIAALIAEVTEVVAHVTSRKAAAEHREREIKRHREEIVAAVEDVGYATAHIWIPEVSDVAYLLAGKTSMMGSLVVTPAAGDAVTDGPWCFGDSKYRRWMPFAYGTKSKAQSFSGRGNLMSEVSLFVLKSALRSGVYGMGQDEDGVFFFPVMYHRRDGVEVLPALDAIKKIRPPIAAEAPVAAGRGKATSEHLAALIKKFGK